MSPIKALRQWAHTEHRYTAWQKWEIFLLLFVMSGVFGFLYEMLFYRIDLGHFVKRGTTFGPWIPIYAYGAGFILLLAYRLRKRPWAVFLVSGLSSGTLEYVVGWALLKFRGERLWDYNTEIWNWGNVNGFICARSVLFFAVSGLLLVYVLVPVATHLADRLSKRAFALLSVVPGALFLADIVCSLIF